MPTLSELKTSLHPDQQDIINALFKYEQLNEGKSMPVISLYDSYGGKQAVEDALSFLDERIILKYPSNTLRRYTLSFLGYLVCDRGAEIHDLLVRYLEYVRSKLRRDCELNHVEFSEFREQANLSEEEFELFQTIFFHTPFHNGGSRSGSGIPPNVDQWFHAKDLGAYVEKLALEKPVINIDSDEGLFNYFDPSRMVSESRNSAPEKIAESLRKFHKDHPDPAKVSFVIMRFGKTVTHETIFRAIAKTLTAVGLTAVRADDKHYHEALLDNVETYMHGCEFGIAVFEHEEGESFNPNVALEVGYMMALKKQVCLLKDQTLSALPTDLTGRLCCNFNPLDLEATISKELSLWLRSKGYTS